MTPLQEFEWFANESKENLYLREIEMQSFARINW